MQTSESLSRDFLRLIVWYPLRWFLLAMPARVGIATLKLMGDLHYAVAKGKRQELVENLQRIGITEKDYEKIIRAYFQNHYLDQLFTLIFPKFNSENITDYVTVYGLPNLDAALLKKKGVILVHGHFGPAHLPLVALALMGYPMKQIGNPSDRGLSWIGRHVAFRLRMLYENRIPAEIIKAGSFLRPIFTTLQQNHVIMTTGDGSGHEQKFGRHGQFTFLGQPVFLPLGPAILAQKTEASLLPLFIVPGKRTLFTIIIENEIVSTLPGEQGTLECTRIFATKMEHYIRSYPGYMHFLDRFRPGLLVEADNSRVG